MASVYATPNKSDTPGEAHRGLSNDTRFGMSGKPSYNNLSQAANRQDNIHRLTLQAHIQSGASRDRGRGRGGRGGRQLGSQQLGRIPQQYHHQYNNPPRNLDPRKFTANQQSLQENQQGMQGGQSGYQGNQPSYNGSQSAYQANHPKYQPKSQTGGMGRGQQKAQGRSRGPGGRGKRKDPIHTHARFQSQVSLAYAADTPYSEFALPIINDTKTEFPLQDYEDEGPSMLTPYGGHGRKGPYDDIYDEERSTDGGVGLGGLKVDDEDMAPLQEIKGHQACKGATEELDTQPQTFHIAPVPVPAPVPAPAHIPAQMSQGTFPPQVMNYPGHFVAPNQFLAPNRFVAPNQFVAQGHFVAPQFIAPNHFMVPHHMVVPHPFVLPNHYVVHPGSQPVPTGRFDGFPPPLPVFQINQDGARQPMMKKQDDDRDEKYIPELGREYARFLDELNEESRARGDLVLEGDLLNERMSMGHLPLDSVSSLNSFDAARDRERRGSPTMNSTSRTAIVDGIRPRRRRPGLRGASARPASPTVQEAEGRLSAPPRDRATLLSPIDFSSRSPTLYGGRKIFGEDSGNLSTDSSDIGRTLRVKKSRFLGGE